MAKKYAVYQLDKVKGKKSLYVPTVKVVTKTLKGAYNTLDCYDEDFEEMGRGWFNKKIGEWVPYVIDDRLMYIPNETFDGVIGIYGRRPIYYIDEYPCPYRYYKVHRRKDKFALEGIRIDVGKVIQRVIDLNIFEDYPIFASCKVKDGVWVGDEYLTKEDLLNMEKEIITATKEKYEEVGKVSIEQDMADNLYITCYYREDE